MEIRARRPAASEAIENMKKSSEGRNMARRAIAWSGILFSATFFLCPEAQAAKANAPRAAASASDAAGRYSVLREGAKDTGCMLTLDSKAKAKGGNKATLAPACRDQGIVIFDPIGWQIVGGRLVLTARKGHTTHLDQQSDGTWLKDPKEGKSLSLKKQ
jgi:hypothetical protein